MGARFVSIWLPYLLTDWHCRKQPALRGTAFVLKAPVHNRAVITAVSPEAAAQGVAPGAVLADARALVPGLPALDDMAGLADNLLRRMAEWCIRFTPVAAPDSPAGILLDVTGCAHLWGGEKPFCADIEKRLSDRGYTVRVALADTAGAAWALARFGGGGIIESGRQGAALMSLPVHALRLDPETTARLNKLGLRTVQHLMAIPRTAIRRRFGVDILTRLRQALGEEEEILQPVFLQEPFQERLPCLEPIRTRTGIEIALQRLLEALCARLQREGKGLRVAKFRCYRIDGAAPGIEIATSRPSHHVEHLFHLFSLKIDTIEPALGIELFILEAPLVEDQDAVQERLWETRGGLDDPRIAELIDRLTGKTGAGSVQRYLPAEHYWPERAYSPAHSISEPASTEWKTDKPRPMQMLSPPEPIEVTAPVPDYPPLLFRHKGRLHKIVKADGPERIEPEWWIQDGPHRDYYVVEDESGARYWLFRLGHYTADRSEKWFLQGYFS